MATENRPGTSPFPAQRNKPPDGGWGWMIVFAYGLANIMIVPVLQSFGLIFRDTFREIHITATQASVIINLASAIGMAFGLFNGPLLRRYGFRKLAIAGGLLFSVGLMLTASAERFAHFIISYSIIASLGMGFCNSSFSLALNTYFVLRRNKAVGIAMTITGLGPILLPQLVSLLLGLYGPRVCLALIGALATHIVAGALLLQPVKWHMLPSVTQPEASLMFPPSALEVKVVPDSENNNNDVELTREADTEFLEKRSFIDHDVDAQSIYGFELTSQLRHRESICQPAPECLRPVIQRATSEVLPTVQRCLSETRSLRGKTTTRPLRWFQSDSIESVHLGSSLAIWDERRTGGSLTDHQLLHTFQSQQHQQHTRLSSMPLTDCSNVGFVPQQKRRDCAASSETINLGSSMKIFDERLGGGPRRASVGSGIAMSNVGKLPVLSENQGLTDESFHLPSIMRTLENTGSKTAATPSVPRQAYTLPSAPSGGFFSKVVHFFDLTLLQDKVYLNMMLGMSIAVFAEINFSLLTPFILGDLGYETQQIASIMSTLALADLVFRFVSPFVGDFLKLSPRVMYMIALTMLIVTRFSILFARTYDEMVIVAFGLGIAKGVRSVYMSLVIPSYIPLKRLPSASSIQMTTNGIVLMTIGPCVGLLRDWTGSYTRSIFLINAFTIVTLLMWTVELICVRHRQNRAKQKTSTMNGPMPTVS